MNNLFAEKIFKKILICTCVCALSACTSDSKEGNAANVSKIGLVDFADPYGDSAGEIFMIFLGPKNALSVADITQDTDPTTPETPDFCKIVFDANEDEGDDLFGSDESTYSRLQAGEVITVSSPAGSFTELRPATATFGSHVYFQPATLTGPYPSDLTFDIPGDDFPAFTAVEVPNVETFLLTSPDIDTEVAIDQEFTWQVGADPASRITLYTDTTYQGAAGQPDKRVQIDCALEDDGSFLFTPAQRTQLTAAGINSLRFHIGREITTTRQQGDALLIITRSSGNL